MTIKIDKPDTELVTPSPDQSADANNGEFTQPVYNKESVIARNQQTGCRTRFNFTNNEVSTPRNK